jgi:arginine exporter protein ArgO
VIVFVFGLLFGLATAFPVGVQSFVVMNQGLHVGYPRVLTGIITASLCDTLLIVAGPLVPRRSWPTPTSGFPCFSSA